MIEYFASLAVSYETKICHIICSQLNSNKISPVECFVHLSLGTSKVLYFDLAALKYDETISMSP
jgi:hypothetical protein